MITVQSKKFNSVLTRPSLSTPAICPVAIRILSGWMAKLAKRERSSQTCHTDQPIGEQQMIYVFFSPLDAVGVSEVMSLSSFFVVKQSDDGCDEVNNLSGWKKVNVCPAVSAAVTITVGSQGNTWKSTEDLRSNETY